MATIVVPPSSSEPSLADLRAMVASTAPQVEAKPEPVAAPVAEATKPEAAPEPADKTQEPEDKEEPLPEGVTKKIAREVERASAIQRKIDEAVSNRKLKEKELADATAKPGSEPAPNTAAAKDAKPVKPSEADSATWAEYQAKLDKYDLEYEAWLVKETRKTVQQEFTAGQKQTEAKAKWDEAVKVHGKEFPALMTTLNAAAPEGLQFAISGLDDWSGVAAHLAKNPARLAEVAAKFAANPYQAVAELGRIEASLKTAPKPAAALPLPKPPVVEGGKSSASVGAFDFETASMNQLRSHVNKLREKR